MTEPSQWNYSLIGFSELQEYSGPIPIAGPPNKYQITVYITEWLVDFQIFCRMESKIGKNSKISGCSHPNSGMCFPVYEKEYLKEPFLLMENCSRFSLNREVRCSSVVRLMSRWVVGSIAYGGPIEYFSFQPVLHNCCNKGRDIYYPACRIVHIKIPCC